MRYVYRVKALRGSDVSLWSNFASIELPADYVAPTPTPKGDTGGPHPGDAGKHSAGLQRGGGGRHVGAGRDYL